MFMRKIQQTAVAILALLWFAHPLYAQQYVSQGTWAVALVRGAGWEKAGIPAKPYLNDYTDLLSGRNFINVNLRGYAARLGDTPDTIVYNVNVAHSGRYHLIVYVTGNPLFFAIDKTSTSSTASGSWGYQDLGTFILSRGMHSLSITMPAGGSVAAVYLSSFASATIAPPGGWNTAQALDYGTEAQTLGMLLHVYDQLPVIYTIPYRVRSAAGASQFAFQTPSNAVVNLTLSFQGPSSGYVMVDSSVVFTYSTRDNPAIPVNLGAVSLGPGMHSAYLKVQSGQMPVSVVINNHDISSATLANIMRTKGYNIGMEGQPVDYGNAVNAMRRLQLDAKAVNAAYYSPGLPAAGPVAAQDMASVSGCGGVSGVIEYKPGTVRIPDNTFIAVAPFENLSGTKGATQAISSVLQEALIESSNVWVTDWDNVAEQLVHYGFRRGIPIGMTIAKTIVSKLKVNMILYGSITGYGYRTGADGRADIPSVSIVLNLLNVQTGRVLFAGSFSMSGNSGDSLQNTAKTLATNIFAEMGK